MQLKRKTISEINKNRIGKALKAKGQQYDATSYKYKGSYMSFCLIDTQDAAKTFNLNPGKHLYKLTQRIDDGFEYKVKNLVTGS